MHCLIDENQVFEVGDAVSVVVDVQLVGNSVVVVIGVEVVGNPVAVAVSRPVLTERTRRRVFRVYFAIIIYRKHTLK